MGLRPLKTFYSFSAGIIASESDVCGRQILKIGLRAVRVDGASSATRLGQHLVFVGHSRDSDSHDIYLVSITLIIYTLYCCGRGRRNGKNILSQNK